MYRNVLLTIVALGFVFLIVGLTVFNSPKIGVVRSADLISRNDMMKEEAGRWTNMEAETKSKIVALEAAIQNLQTELNGSEVDDVESILSDLNSKQRQHSALSEELYQKMAQREKEILGAVLSRINSAAQSYGEEHGFDIILGSSSDGNILYGREHIDITDELIEAMNLEYHDAR